MISRSLVVVVLAVFPLCYALGSSEDVFDLDAPGNAERYPEIKKIEADFDKSATIAEDDFSKQIEAAAARRARSYRDLFEEVKTSGDIDKAAAIRERLRYCEAAIDKPDQPTPRTKIKILSATYGINQSWFDVTDKLKAKIGRAAKWTATVSDADWGDPAPGYEVGNTLVVRYSVNGKVKMAAVYEGRRISLP